MTDEEQWDLMDQMRFEMSADAEFKIREMAREVVEAYGDHPSLSGVVANNAVLFPVHVRGGYRDIRVYLLPALRNYPQEAQLIAEQQIREQWPS